MVNRLAVTILAMLLGVASSAAPAASTGATPPGSTMRPGKIMRGPDGQIILVPDGGGSQSSSSSLPPGSGVSRPAPRSDSDVEIDEVFVHPGHGQHAVIEGKDFGKQGAKSAVWLADAPQWQNVSKKYAQKIVSWSNDAIEIVVNYGPMTKHGKYGQFRLHALEKNLPDVWVYVRDAGGERNDRGARFVTPLSL